MKIILNIEPIKFPLTGIGRYTYELAKELQLSSDIDELKFFSGNEFADKVPEQDRVVAAKSETSSIRALAKKSRLAVWLYHNYKIYNTSKALKNQSDYIYHSPNFFTPRIEGKKVVTFHDLSIFTWPECHPKERVRYMQKELLFTVQHADALITDSEYTRRELAEYFNYPLEKVFAVPLASSGDFYPRPEDETTRILDQYGLREKQYILFTGSVEPRKNLKTLLDAYERLPLPMRLDCPLVISGYRGWESGDVHKKMAQGESEGWVRYLGFTPAADLPFIFSGARVFAFPSLYEGFGLPVLEAMASGTPVLCSNASCLPEVAGDAALMFEPLHVENLTELLKRGIEDTQWRENARELGLQRAKLFSWQRCAKETIDVYKQV
jgi:glycosyltransferase involved in cell wall biosynthesis